MRILGRFALLLATAAFLTSVTLFIIGGFLMTWPVLRKSPRNRRLKATSDLAVAAIEIAAAFGRRDD